MKKKNVQQMTKVVIQLQSLNKFNFGFQVKTQNQIG